MIEYTIDQAAQRVDRDRRTITRWLAGGMPSRLEPITGRRYIREADLLQADRDARHGVHDKALQRNLASQLDNLTSMSYLEVNAAREGASAHLGAKAGCVRPTDATPRPQPGRSDDPRLTEVMRLEWWY